jgi:hypothetical protein
VLLFLTKAAIVRKRGRHAALLRHVSILMFVYINKKVTSCFKLLYNFQLVSGPDAIRLVVLFLPILTNVKCKLLGILITPQAYDIFGTIFE